MGLQLRDQCCPVRGVCVCVGGEGGRHEVVMGFETQGTWYILPWVTAQG